MKNKGKPVIINLEFSENWYPVSTIFAKVICALVKKESPLKNGMGSQGILATHDAWEDWCPISFSWLNWSYKCQDVLTFNPWPSTSPKQYTWKYTANIWVIYIGASPLAPFFKQDMANCQQLGKQQGRETKWRHFCHRVYKKLRVSKPACEIPKNSFAEEVNTTSASCAGPCTHTYTHTQDSMCLLLQTEGWCSLEIRMLKF